MSGAYQYDDLDAAMFHMSTEVARLRTALAASEARVKALEDALRFYASGEHILSTTMGTPTMEGGEHARAALEGAKAEEEP